MRPTLLTCRNGTVLVFMAVMLPLLIAVLGVVIDFTRLTAVKSKAQSASDAALLGAVSTISSNNGLYNEYMKQFVANFPSTYMGSYLAVASTSSSNGVYTATQTIQVPTIIMNFASNNSTNVTITSQVTTGFKFSPTLSVELTFVIDSSKDMTQAQLNEMTSDATALIQSLATNGVLPANVHVNVVPFDIVANVGTNHANWAQTTQPSCTAWQTQYECAHMIWMSDSAKYQLISSITGQSLGVFSNRQSDYLAGFYNDHFNDVDDSPPTTEATRFRLPNANIVYDKLGNNAAGYPFATSYSFADSVLANIDVSDGGPPVYNPVNGTQYAPGNGTPYIVSDAIPSSFKPNATYSDATACYFWDTPGNPFFMQMQPPDPDPINSPMTGIVVTNTSGEVAEPPQGSKGTYIFTVTLPQAARQDITLIGFTQNVFQTWSAIAGTDYSPTFVNTVIRVGQRSIQIPVTILGAPPVTLPNGATDKQFNFVLNMAFTTQGGFQQPITTNTATGYIKENVGPTVHKDCINSTPLPAPLVFADNDLGDLGNKLSNLQPTNNYTRVNVGLMWGWFTLSSKWTGLWDGGGTLPAKATTANQVIKVMVLMGSNLNSVYNGTTYNQLATSKDDTTTKTLCDAIKASPDHITIFTVSPSGAPANPVLAYCASQPNYYINAAASSGTTTGVMGIANSVLWDTMRISQ